VAGCLERGTLNIYVAAIHFVCHFFRIFNLRPSTHAIGWLQGNCGEVRGSGR